MRKSVPPSAIEWSSYPAVGRRPGGVTVEECQHGQGDLKMYWSTCSRTWFRLGTRPQLLDHQLEKYVDKALRSPLPSSSFVYAKKGGSIINSRCFQAARVSEGLWTSVNITREISLSLITRVYEGFFSTVNAQTKAYRLIGIEDWILPTFSPLERLNRPCLLLSEDGYWLDVMFVDCWGSMPYLCMQKPGIYAVVGAIYMLRGAEHSNW